MKLGTAKSFTLQNVSEPNHFFWVRVPFFRRKSCSNNYNNYNSYNYTYN